MSHSDLTYDIIGAAMEVYRGLGSRRREQAYANVLPYEPRLRSYRVDQQRAWPIDSKEEVGGDCFSDLVVTGDLITAGKAITKLGDEKMSQIINSLRILKLRIGDRLHKFYPINETKTITLI